MWKPVWGRVIVKPDKIEDTDPHLRRAREAGIVIPEAESKREQNAQIEGVIVDIGGNCFDEWIGLLPKAGDRVIFDKYAGFMKKIGGEEYRFVSDTDIIAVWGE